MATNGTNGKSNTYLGPISAALSFLPSVQGRTVGSFPEQLLVIELNTYTDRSHTPTNDYTTR